MSHHHEPWQIRETDGGPGGRYCAACGAPIQNRDPAMTLATETDATTDTDSSSAVPTSPHRLEITLQERPLGYIEYRAVCDAPVGAPCRMWCEHPDCQEDSASDDHDTHVLVDHGECGVTTWLNCDKGMIPELYTGPTTTLRQGFIEIASDFDGVTWTYAEDAAPGPAELAELAEYRRRDAAGRVEFGLQAETDSGGRPVTEGGLTQGGASAMRILAAARGVTARIMQRTHAAPSAWAPAQGPACSASCRHQCPECRAGLGSHLTCDPQCAHHLPPADR